MKQPGDFALLEGRWKWEDGSMEYYEGDMRCDPFGMTIGKAVLKMNNYYSEV